MEVDLVVVTGLAGIGTTLGAWAMIWTYRQGKRLQELQGRLAAHNVAQIDRAELLIRWVPSRVNDLPRIWVENRGQAEATSVDIEFEGKADYLLDDKLLPIKSLRAGAVAQLRALGLASWGPPFEATVTWKDPSGERSSTQLLTD